MSDLQVRQHNYSPQRFEWEISSTASSSDEYACKDQRICSKTEQRRREQNRKDQQRHRVCKGQANEETKSQLLVAKKLLNELLQCNTHLLSDRQVLEARIAALESEIELLKSSSPGGMGSLDMAATTTPRSSFDNALNEASFGSQFFPQRQTQQHAMGEMELLQHTEHVFGGGTFQYS